ncbi:MAG TPA: ABATE domain-containing protein [bacterium]|nr:ABATE domain-containing protein [bacterium]
MTTDEARQSQEYVFDLSGGSLCLNFVDTVSGSRARPTERLRSYEDLVSWGRQSGAITYDVADRLAQAAERRPRDAGGVLAEALRLREALFRIFSASVEDLRAPERVDVELLNSALSEALQHHRIVKTPEGFAWAWADDRDALERIVWPVVHSAADLLTSPDLRRVRRCAGADCDWLFMDLSRNRTRRWCDMKGCGNRAKARRYYERHRAHAEGGRAPG